MAEAGVDTPLFHNGLRKALQSGEIEILFQPQVEIATGRIVGAEALARWQQPDIGELGAETLFGVAAQAGLSTELSEHVQRRAVAEAAAWPVALAGLRLSVNITAADTVRAGFARQFLAMIEQSGFDRSRVTVEVTETELIENLDAAASLLAQLREQGLRVALDDFGTGYSSLLYLKVLPLDALKIDKRLTEDITGSERDRIVIRGVISIAQALGLEVIAEGVETDEQLRLLATEGCALYQGFLCSPPVDAATLATLAAASR
jgi:EAL domain-containing protein (putative c-di-GMP-specific phosphodiesterase class I)